MQRSRVQPMDIMLPAGSAPTSPVHPLSIMSTSTSAPKNLWLDCDPGHDDAIALLLALYLPEAVNLIGVSTVSPFQYRIPIAAHI